MSVFSFLISAGGSFLTSAKIPSQGAMQADVSTFIFWAHAAPSELQVVWKLQIHALLNVPIL